MALSIRDTGPAKEDPRSKPQIYLEKGEPRTPNAMRDTALFLFGLVVLIFGAFQFWGRFGGAILTWWGKNIG